MKKPLIFKVLDVSTGHMTKNDSELLDSDLSPLTAYPYGPNDGTGPYGHLVHLTELDTHVPPSQQIDEDLAPALKYGYSQELCNILREAKSLDCQYVRFDRDGEEYPELPTFDW
jgi:hypothetical protein